MTVLAPAREEGRATEWLLRTFAVLVLAAAVAALAHAWRLDGSRWTLPLLLFCEAYTLALVLCARRAAERDLSPLALLSTGYAVLFVVLLDPRGTVELLPDGVGVSLQVAGLLWQLAAKATLGRAFGLLPAQRGTVTRGPYRLVRHPIYLGYLVSHAGFLLANFSWRNAGVLALLYALQLLRMRREEALMARSLEYRAYQRRVRWRLLPFVY